MSKPATAKNLADLALIAQSGGSRYLASRWADDLESKGLVTTSDRHMVRAGNAFTGRQASYQVLCTLV